MLQKETLMGQNLLLLSYSNVYSLYVTVYIIIVWLLLFTFCSVCVVYTVYS